MKSFSDFLEENKHLFPRMTAQLRANKHETKANKAFGSDDKDTGRHHVRAHDRFAKLAKGKAPFQK
jgi:hypothetical protein